MSQMPVFATGLPLPAAAGYLKSRILGQVILPGETGYDEARQAWNRSVDQYPALIVVPESARDLQSAVNFAREHHLGIAVQATGHGIIRPADDAMLILTKGLNQLDIDPLAQTARIGAGVLWGEVLAAAQKYGLAPLLGSSPGVGAVGYTLGGGLGWLGRKYGLSLDNVLRFEIVTADGRRRTVSATENSDLFWGLRGGGGSLGIVSSMTARLFPVTRVYAGNLYYAAGMAVEVFRRYRDWIAAAPDSLTSSVLIMNFPPLPELPEFLRGQTYAVVRGCYCGRTSEAEALLRFWRDWQAPLLDDFKTMPFSEAAAISSDPIDPLPGFMSGAWLRELSDGAIDSLVTFAVGADGTGPLVMTEVRHAGGAIQRAGTTQTAYGNRDAELLLSLVGIAPTKEAYRHLENYSDRLKEALRPDLTGGVYMNFLEGSESQQRIRDGLAPGAYDRLAQLKAQVDPANLLRYSFNIEPGEPAHL
jgi:FAD binding domain